MALELKENLEKYLIPSILQKKVQELVYILVKKIINAHYGFIEINSFGNITKILIRISI